MSTAPHEISFSLGALLGTLGESVPRERFQDPEIYQNENGSYCIRPWVDVIQKDGTLGRAKKRITLGDSSIGRRGAMAAKRRVMETINRASYVIQSQVTFGTLLDEFDKRHVSRQAFPTQNKYRSLIKVHLKTAFADLRLCEVTAKRVQEWLDAKALPIAEVKDATGKVITRAKDGASWSTRNDLRNLLSGIFERAIAWKYWQDANPIQHVTAGRKRLVRQKIKLTDDQTRRLLAKLPGQVRIVAQVALFTGLRISEVLALKEKSLEFATGQIYVQERFHRGDLDVTKNRAAERRVPMGYLADELAKLCMGDAERYIFNIETMTGRPGKGRKVYICRDDRSLQNSFLRPAAKEVGCYTLGFGWHALRREAVTEFNATLGVTQAMRLAGHSSVAMSAEYTLAEMTAQDKAVRERQERLTGIPETQKV